MASLKEHLKNKLTKKQLDLTPSSFDVIGNIAIMDIPEELKSQQKLIANTLMEIQKNIKTVLKKAGIHKGKYRTQKLTWIAGKKTRAAEYKESGTRMKLNVEKCYFSPRSSTERLRIAKLVKPNEEILVMFSGVAPFPLVIAKNAKPHIIYGIELNPVAHKYAKANIVLNKFRNRIKLFKGDVNKVIPELKLKFDRILMPMPKTAEKFLPIAFKAAKKGSIIHYYDFGRESEFTSIEEKIKNTCKKAKKKCKIIRTVKAGQYAPGTFRICIDFRIL